MGGGMKAQQLSMQVQGFGRPLARVLRDLPVPGGTQVIVRVGHCGVCHSDVHLQDGFFDLGAAGKTDLSRSMRPPRTLGHEIAGEVIAVGPDARGVVLGGRYVVYPWIGCGQCADCQRGDEHLCGAPSALGINADGGFSTHVIVPHPRYLFDYTGLDEAQAATYACSGLTAFGALRHASPLPPQAQVLIIGAGGVGLSAIRLARHVLGDQVGVWVAEPDAAKWSMAREAGAGEVFDPNATDALKRLQKSTAGGVHAAIDFVGSSASFALGFAALRKFGHLICVGLFGGATSIAPALITLKSLAISGSYVGSLSDMDHLMALARSGVLPPMPVSVRGLEEADASIADLRDGRARGRIVLAP